MGFFGMRLEPGEKEAVEVPPGWCLQLCTAAMEPAKKGSKSKEASATLWVQVEGEIGDSRFLLGSLQSGGQCAQIPVGHCFTSVDGEVVVETEGNGVVHLTGFFNREYDPDLENDDMTDSSSEVSSGDDSEESSEKDSGEESECGSDDSGEAEMAALKAVLKDKFKARTKTQGKGKETNGVGKGVGSKAAAGKGRGLRSAAVAAALACGTGDGAVDHPEDDSDADSEYVPGDEDVGDGDGDGGVASKAEEEEEEGGRKKGKRARRSEAGEGEAAGSKSSASGTGGGGSPSSSSPPSKKSKPDGEDKEDAEKSELTKQERKRQRKKENKMKAAEAKRGLEEAFGAMEADDGALPVGVPLKNPRSKTLKGGLKIKDTIFGGGKIAVPGKNVKVCYEGCFPDGRVFDKNQNRRRPLQFRIGMRSVIVGMDRGVEGMRVGGSREIAIPAALAYGARGTGPIPANQDLVFRVEMIDVLGK